MLFTKTSTGASIDGQPITLRNLQGNPNPMRDAVPFSVLFETGGEDAAKGLTQKFESIWAKQPLGAQIPREQVQEWIDFQCSLFTSHPQPNPIPLRIPALK